MVPDQLGITLDKALETERRPEEGLRQPTAKSANCSTWRMKIEGLARNVGTHAAAVVIADQPLTDYVPLQPRDRQGQKSSPNGRWATSKRPAC